VLNLLPKMKVLTTVSLLLSLYSAYAAVVPKIKLNTGKEIPQIGIGTWQATGDPVVQAVKDALAAGYRHIDTAFVYKNEKEVGKGLHESINAGVVKREDVFITTKVWPDGSDQKKALETIHHSLTEMNITYVDLVLVHFPHGNYSDTYKGLEDAFEQKLAHSIGISNFNVHQIETLMKTAKVKPAMNQIQIHPKVNQDETVDYCKKHDIAITGYSPLGQGSLINDPTLTEIGKKHNKTSAQVMIRWQIQRELVVIPKSVHKERIIEDFNVFDFELTADEMKTIHSMH
jgi:diketogulonate reductase-like aldo/keto reductase